jgi:energy-coupling factor transport system ATP-binding protein
LVLSDINASFGGSEFVCILGLNGSGKTTLAKLLNALLTSSNGSVKVDDMDSSDEIHKWKIRQKVGMVFQNPDNQFISSSVEEDIAFGPENLGLPRSEIRKRVDWAVEVVGIGELLRKDVHSLSGGQKQLAAIACALAIRPKYLVLDEATSMLDPASRLRIMELLKSLQKNGLSVIHITQHVDEILFADRIITLRKGKIMCDLSLDGLFENLHVLAEAGFDPPMLWSFCKKIEALSSIKIGAVRNEKELAGALCC